MPSNRAGLCVAERNPAWSGGFPSPRRRWPSRRWSAARASRARYGVVLPDGRWHALAAKHALQERGGLDQLAGTREASGFANYVLIQHRIHLVLSARAALTAGVACRAPSTETEAMVARARSGVTSWAMVARPRTLMCSISPARRAASRSSRL